MAVRIETLESHIGRLFVLLDDRHIVGPHTREQRADLVRVVEAEAEVQELRQRAHPAAGMQGKVETVTVANDQRAVVTALRRVRIEPKVPLVENPTALRVTDRQTEMDQVHVAEHARLHRPDDEVPPLAGAITDVT